MHSKKIVNISVDLRHRHAHLFTVTMTLENAAQNQRLSLPVWTPGSYMVREFSQHIVAISADERGHPINIAKINKNTFETKNSGGAIRITYQVYGFDSSIRAAYLDSQQAFFNGTALFLRPHGFDDAQFTLTIERPADVSAKNYCVATAMTKVKTDEAGFGSYRSENYDELVDHPFQISEMRRITFSAANVPHEMVLVGDVRPFDEERLKRDLRKICEYQIAMFGGTAPFSSYLFISRFEEGGHGGLEHRASTMLLSTPYSLPKIGLGEPDGHYRGFLALCSHEYFHAWNVKRLKPDSFVPYDFDNECYTSMLWIFEGITSYYDDLAVKRAGAISLGNYLDLLSKNYHRLIKNRGRHMQTIADSSFDAWIKFYRPHENSHNTAVSYYLKGGFLGLYLDLMIREASSYQVSLDDVMRAAFAKYGDGQGMSEEQFLSLLQEITPIDVGDFRRRFIYGTDEIPIKEALSNVGIELTLLPDIHGIDDKIRTQAYVGLKLRFDDHGRAVISLIEQDGPGMHAGLNCGDEVVAINGIRLDSHNASDLLGAIKVGEPVVFLYSRRKVMRSTEVMPTALPMQMCKITLRQDMPEETRKKLERWAGAIGPERTTPETR